MIENWNLYKDLEYYPGRFCACSCGGRIEVKSHHKKYGIPKYISGHNRAGRKKIPVETRICECGCGGTFECRVNSKQRFIYHHQRLPRETRVCICGCDETFECKINSKQRYVCGHNRRNKPLSIEHKKKIGKSRLGKSCTGRKKLPRIKKICPGCSREFITPTGTQERRFHDQECYRRYQREFWPDLEFAKGQIKSYTPTKPEMKLDKLLMQLFLNQWEYVGDRTFWMRIDGRNANPDFINVDGQKKIIEMFGAYWHKPEEEQERMDLFAKSGYQTLIVWDYELEDLEKLNVKLLCFNQIGG